MERPAFLALVRAQATRFSHFHAGRLGSSWKTEFLRLRTVSEGTLKEWNCSVDRAEREACHRVGKLVGKGLALTAEEEATRAQATKYGENVLRSGLASLTDRRGQFRPPRK